jgi:hypothetical protein
MPIPERYYREMIARRAEEERLARRDSAVEWVRVVGQIVWWTALGLAGLGLALHNMDIDRGWVYWWGGAFVWVAGVFVALITGYLRGVRRGDWE